jgi:transposase InsO family protein
MQDARSNTNNLAHGQDYPDDAGKPGAEKLACRVWREAFGAVPFKRQLAGCLPYFVGQFKLSVAQRRPYRTLGDFLRAAEAWVNFYNHERPHEGIENLSPLQYAKRHGLEDIPFIAL